MSSVVNLSFINEHKLDVQLQPEVAAMPTRFESFDHRGA